jgi:hypothetical protein
VNTTVKPTKSIRSILSKDSSTTNRRMKGSPNKKTDLNASFQPTTTSQLESDDKSNLNESMQEIPQPDASSPNKDKDI